MIFIEDCRFPQITFIQLATPLRNECAPKGEGSAGKMEPMTIELHHFVEQISTSAN